jgi:nucleoid DNA-binding protein
MTKNEIIKVLAKRCCFRQEDVESILNAFGDLMYEQASKGKSLTLTGYFKMEVKERAARTHFNPIEGKKFNSSPRNVVIIHTGSRLKEIGKQG